MAEDKQKPTEDTSEVVKTAPPTWVASTQQIINALLQGQPQPQGTATQASSPANPWLKALEEQQAPSLPPTNASMLPPATPGKADLALPWNKKATPFQLPQSIPVSQVPVSTVMQMQQHQVNPNVENAKQRMMQALMQHLQQPHRG